MALTKLDITALRKADSVVFFSDFIVDWSQGYPRSTYTGSIRAIKRSDATKDPFSVDKHFEIQVDGVHLTNYKSDQFQLTNGVAHISSAQFDDVWRTIAGMLRADDHIILRWVASNNNQYLDEANLHHDTLELEIHRGNKKKVFQVTDSICQHNSARMVR